MEGLYDRKPKSFFYPCFSPPPSHPESFSTLQRKDVKLSLSKVEQRRYDKIILRALLSRIHWKVSPQWHMEIDISISIYLYICLSIYNIHIKWWDNNQIYECFDAISFIFFTGQAEYRQDLWTMVFWVTVKEKF